MNTALFLSQSCPEPPMTRREWDENAERRRGRTERGVWETRDKEYRQADSAWRDDYIERRATKWKRLSIVFTKRLTPKRRNEAECKRSVEAHVSTIEAEGQTNPTPATKTDTAVDTIVSTAVSLFYRKKHRQNKHL